MMSTTVRCALAVVLIGGLGASAHASYITGFEASDGFTVDGSWPAGWTAETGVRVGTTWVNGGSQSLEVGNTGPGTWSAMDYTLATPITFQADVVTEVSVDIRTSSALVPGYYNFVGFGFFIVSDREGYSAGSVNFDLEDWGYDNWNDPTDFIIATCDPEHWDRWYGTGKFFSPGSSYRFATLIDWSAGTTTLRLTDLGGSVVHQDTVDYLPNGVASVRFGGAQYSDSLPVYFDNFYIGDAPEPATMSLLALGGLALIRRRRRA